MNSSIISSKTLLTDFMCAEMKLNNLSSPLDPQNGPANLNGKRSTKEPQDLERNH